VLAVHSCRCDVVSLTGDAVSSQASCCSPEQGRPKLLVQQQVPIHTTGTHPHDCCLLQHLLKGSNAELVGGADGPPVGWHQENPFCAADSCCVSSWKVMFVQSPSSG
jgi:hypothetical protein